MTSHKSVLAIIAWCLYDWAAASFSVIVITFIFGTYFVSVIAANKVTGTAQWANATSLAGLAIAVSSPIFGAIADHGGHHKRWLSFFTFLCICSSGLLWFAYPTTDAVYPTLACVMVGMIGFEIALVFYNSFLPYIASPKQLGRISGWGWGSGYLGGIIALSIILFLSFKMKLSWLDRETYEQIRICGPFVAIWYALFSFPFFYLIPDIPAKERPLSTAISLGWGELISTLKKLPHNKDISLYLIAHMIYTDGLNTLFIFGGIYAVGTYGLSYEEVLVFGITMNIMAGIGAILLGWMDDFIGSKPTIIASLLCLILFGIPILFLHNKWLFWASALLLCVFVGPVQSASRSLMVRLMDKKLSAEMFGLYSLSGKMTSFIGPWILGMTTLAFESQRVGMATILLFFLIGGLLMLLVNVHSPTALLSEDDLLKVCN